MNSCNRCSRWCQSHRGPGGRFAPPPTRRGLHTNVPRRQGNRGSAPTTGWRRRRRARPRSLHGRARPRRRCRKSDAAPPGSGTADDRTGFAEVTCSIDSCRIRSRVAHTWTDRTSADLSRNWETRAAGQWYSRQAGQAVDIHHDPVARLADHVGALGDRRPCRHRRRPRGTCYRLATPPRFGRHRPPTVRRWRPRGCRADTPCAPRRRRASRWRPATSTPAGHVRPTEFAPRVGLRH